MKVITPAAETIDLGITETTPTIGINDFSRRVTDDFGVTTVVKRAFSRTMSLRFAVPTANVDAVSRTLAALRATAAQWIADDRYSWLGIQGFYKDFEATHSVGEKSFCSLTIEGLAQYDAVPDAGGDPAPVGASSLMLLQPVTITPAMLVASSVAENDYPAWSGATTYATGARVIYPITHRVYESAANGNIGHDPTGDSGLWIDIGPTKRWAMFDQALGTITSAVNEMVVTIDPGATDALALLDVVGDTVRVQKAGYDRTLAIGDGPLTFLDLPGAAGQITVTIMSAGGVSVGTLLVGKLVTLGVTGDEPTTGINDFSRKEVDDFGEVTVVERSWAKRMSARALIRTDAIDLVANRIATVRALPSLWIAQDGTDALTIYGFFKEFSIEVDQTVSTLSLSIEGLSEAAPLSAGLPPPKWTDIVDNDPVNHPKPEDGATVGAPAGTPVGNRPSETLNAQVDTALAQVDDLFANFGSTESANAAMLAAQEARDDALDAAGAAGGYATVASTKRDEASGFASTAQAEALTARLAAAGRGLTLNAEFAEGIAGWTSSLSADADNALPTALVATDNWNGAARVARSNGIAGQLRGNVTAYSPSRKYRLRARYYANGPTTASFGVSKFDGAGTYTAYSAAYYLTSTPGGWVNVNVLIDPAWFAGGEVQLAPYGMLNWLGETADAGLDYLYIEDVTESEAAGISASIADAKAVAASASESSAAADAALAAGFRGEAEDFKNAAQTQAGISSSAAATATASAASANDSKNVTANYKADVIKIDGNFSFDLGADNWFGYFDIPTGAISSPISGEPNFSIVTGNAAYFGTDLHLAPSSTGDVFCGTLLPVNTARKYRFRAQVSAWRAVPGGSAEIYLGFVGLDGDGKYLDHGAYGTYRYCLGRPVNVVNGAPLELSAVVTGEGNDSWTKFPPGTKYVRLMAIINYTSTDLHTYLGGIWMDDVTETEAASSSASFAAAQAVIATDNAAAAKASEILSASMSRGYQNGNANFASWPTAGSTDPGSGWSIWNYLGGNTLERFNVATMGYDVPPEGSPYCARSTVGASDQTGLIASDTPAAPGPITIETTAYLSTGGWGGSGLLVYFLSPTKAYLDTAYLAHAVDPDTNGLVSASSADLRKWSKTVAAPANTAYIRIYAMTNYPAGMGTMAAKTMFFLKAGWKQGGATEATVQVHDSVLSTHTAQLASRVERVSAGPATAELKFVALNSGGTAASQITIRADEVALGSMTQTALKVAGGNALFSGNIAVGGGIFVGDSAIPVALQAFDMQVYDGQTVSYGANLGNLPKLDADFSTFPALTAGQSYVFRADSHTATGFIARVKKVTAATPVTQTSAAGTNPGSGPTFQAQKPTSADAYDGKYKFSVSGTIYRDSDSADGHTIWIGWINFQTWFRPAGAGSWTAGPVVKMNAGSGSLGNQPYTATITADFGTAIGLDATNTEFGISIYNTYSVGTNTLTALNSVSYNTLTGATESTATPSNLPLLPLKVTPQNG